MTVWIKYLILVWVPRVHVTRVGFISARQNQAGFFFGCKAWWHDIALQSERLYWIWIKYMFQGADEREGIQHGRVSFSPCYLFVNEIISELFEVIARITNIWDVIEKWNNEAILGFTCLSFELSWSCEYLYCIFHLWRNVLRWCMLLLSLMEILPF